MRPSSRAIPRILALGIALQLATVPASAAPSVGKPAAGRAPARSATSGGGSQGQEASFTWAQAACTDQENWTFSSRIPEAWQKQFSVLPLERGSQIRVFSWGHALRSAGKTAEAQLLGEYWMWRSLHQAGLVHLAYRGFNALVSREHGAESDWIRFAALECLVRIRREFPAVVITPAAVEFSAAILKRPLTDGQKAVAWEAVAAFAKRRIAEAAEGANPPMLDAEIAALKGSGPWESMVLAYQASSNLDDVAAVRHAEQFLKQVSDPAPAGMLREQQEAVKLLLGRARYHLGKYEEAMQVLRKMDNTSNLFSQSLVDLGWTGLQRKLYVEAGSAAQNLLTGKLARTFAPEAPMILAIAQFENCRYPDSLRSVRWFRKTYEPAYKWLYQWRTDKTKSGGSLYPQVLGYLKKTAKIPDHVGTEWIRSPVFQASQHEINLVLDERERIREWEEELNRSLRGPQAKAIRKAKTSLLQMLSQYKPQLRTLEEALVARIERDLEERSKQMLFLMAEVAENGQLIEAEIFNEAGEDIIAANFPGKKRPVVQARKGAATPEEIGPTLDWGRYPAGKKEGQGEIWQDEVGALRTELSDKCPKR